MKLRMRLGYPPSFHCRSPRLEAHLGRQDVTFTRRLSCLAGVRDVYTRAEDGVDIDARDGASKISQQLVPLPSAARTKDLALEGGEDATLGATPTRVCGGAYVEGRAQEDGLQANYGLPHPQAFRLKHLSSYLAREHDVAPRALDEALYEVRGVYYGVQDGLLIPSQDVSPS